MNFLSIWGVRLTLAALLAPAMGLKGIWIAMCINCVSGEFSSLSGYGVMDGSGGR